MVKHSVGVRAIAGHPRPLVIINPADTFTSDAPHASYEVACRHGLSLALEEGWKLRDETGLRQVMSPMYFMPEVLIPQTPEQRFELAADVARVIAGNESVLSEHDLAILEMVGAFLLDGRAA